MESNVCIDVGSTLRCAYSDPTPLTVMMGEHKVTINLTNIPPDMTEAIENQKQRYAELDALCRGLQSKVTEEDMVIQALKNATNDAPRPPLSDEGVKDILSFVKTANLTELNQRVVLVRLVTGWNTARAKAFVEHN